MEFLSDDIYLEECINVFKCHPVLKLDLNYGLRVICDKEIKYDNVCHVFPYAIFESLLPYLGPHYILQLMTVSKDIRSMLVNMKNPIRFDLDTLCFDVIAHDCKCCKSYLSNSLMLLPKIFMEICKKGDKSQIQYIGDSYLSLVNCGVKFTYPKFYVQIEGCVKTEINFIHNCVLNASKRDNINKYKLLKYVSNLFRINQIDTLKIFFDTSNIKIIKTIVSKLFAYGDCTVHIKKFMLPYVCSHGMVDYINSCTRLDSTYSSYKFILQLLINNVDVYSSEIIERLLDILSSYPKYDQDNENIIIDLAAKFGGNRLISNLLKIHDDSVKLRLIPKIYELGLSNSLKLNFLDNTKELNMLSITEASKWKKFDVVVYVDKLDTKEILQNILNNDNQGVKSALILQLDDVSLFHNEMKAIINWIIHGYKIESIDYVIKKLINHIMRMQHLDTNLKILLVPFAYQNACTSHLGFLNDSKELNMLSIQEACNINGKFCVEIYSDRLSYEEKLQLIIDINNLEVKKKLFDDIVNSNILENSYMMEKFVRCMSTCGCNISGRYFDKILTSKNIDNKLKLLLVPLAYYNSDGSKFEFLNENKETNMLSVQEALKHIYSDKFIFIDHLTNKELLPFIVKATDTNNYKIRKLLIKKVKCYQLKYYDVANNIDDEMIIYSQIQNMLPAHHIYNEASYTYEDEDVICKYKLKIDNKVLNLDYTKLVLQIDLNCYCKVFEHIISELRNTGYFDMKDVRPKARDVVAFMVEHEQFNRLSPYSVITLLKMCTSFKNYGDLCTPIIKNHKFFNQFV
jgi:hypothetical protein